MPDPLFRKPQRISVTLPHHVNEALIKRSSREGRSISNLAAFLLEQALLDMVPESDAWRHDKAA